MLGGVGGVLKAQKVLDLISGGLWKRAKLVEYTKTVLSGARGV